MIPADKYRDARRRLGLPESDERPSIDELMSRLSPKAQAYWCEGGSCGCNGCANNAGHLSAFGYSQEDWQRWLASESAASENS
jgi:hypothetical protein